MIAPLALLVLLQAAAFAAPPAAPAAKTAPSLKLETLTATPFSRWFSADGSMSAVEGENSITVWSLPKGKPLFRIESPLVERVGPNDLVHFKPSAFSGDGRWLLAVIDHRRSDSSKAWTRNTVQFVLVSVTEEKIVRTLASFEGPCVHGRGISTKCLEMHGASFAADGRRVVLHGQRNMLPDVTYENFMVVYDLEGKKLVDEKNVMRSADSVALKPSRMISEFRGIDADGRMLGVTADENSCALIDLSDRKRLAFLEDCTAADNPWLMPAHRYLYSAGDKSSERKIWDYDGSVRARARLAPPRPGGETVYFYPQDDGRYAIEARYHYDGGWRHDFAVWDLKLGRRLAAAEGEAFDGGFAFRLAADRKHLIQPSSKDGKVYYSRLDAGTPLAPSAAGRSAAVDLAAAPPEASSPVVPPPAPARNFDAPPSSASPVDPDAYAVIIGVEKYRASGIPRVEYAARDARTMHAYATAAMGFDPKNVVLLTDEQATRTDFEKHLGSWLKNRVGPKSRVFVYYAGHGAPNPATGEGYLMPYEADASYLEDTAYPVAKLHASLAKLPTKDVTVVLDACFSGQGGRSLLAKGARPLVNVVQPAAAPNAVVLAAAQSNQISASDPDRRHGLLTSYLLEGLSGAADADGDGRIMAPEIYAYVRPAVERAARLQNLEQTPTISPSPAALAAQPGRPWITLPAKK